MPGDHSLVKSDDPQHPANLIPESVYHIRFEMNWIFPSNTDPLTFEIDCVGCSTPSDGSLVRVEVSQLEMGEL